ncbi:MAG: lysophospholipid acyltransferase family protein [Verrucomicrobiota bacterium]
MFKKSNWSYSVTWFFGRPLLEWWMDIQVSGGENLPASGPVLLLSNHISHFDPPLVGYGVNRPVDFLTSAEFFENSWVNRFFRAVNAFPFRRDQAQDLKAMRWLRSRMDENRVVCIFPERGIRHGKESVLAGNLFPPGTAELAFRWDLPIVPMVILGSDQFYSTKAWMNRRPVYVSYLKPLRAKDFKDSTEMNLALGEAMHAEVRRLIQVYDLESEMMPRAAEEHWALAKS